MVLYFQIYKLSRDTHQDSERKVRELALQVHSKITANAGRNLAPHLNTLMGY